MKTTAIALILESGLEQGENVITTTRVETKRRTHQITETNTSKPWATSWCNDKTCMMLLSQKSFKHLD